MYSWVVKKALLRHLHEQMQNLLVLALLIAFFTTLVPIIGHNFGARQDVTCWLSELRMTSVPVVLNKVRDIDDIIDLDGA